MAIGSSNTFNLPGQGDSLVLSRENYNSSLRALLQNFYASNIPDTENFVNMGSAMTSGDINGVLYRSSNTGMLYISDTNIGTTRTNNPVGGKFTRYGIAWRQQENLAAAAANIATFDLGEAFVVVNHPVAANNRMYLRTKTSTGTMADFIDIGSPPAGSASFTGDVTATDGTFITSSSIAGNKFVLNYNTSSSGGAQSAYLAAATASGGQGIAVGHANSDKHGFLYLFDNSYLALSTNALERMRIHAGGSVGIHTYNVSTANLNISTNYVPSADGNCEKIRLYDDGITSYGFGLQGGQLNITAGGGGTAGSIGFYTTGRTMTILPTNNVVIGGTSAIAKLHVEGDIYSSTGYKCPDGTVITTSAGGRSNVQIFSAAGAATWTKPSGYSANSRVYVQLWGGGGSGGKYSPNYAPGGGGGSYNEGWYLLSDLSSTESITVGSGGASVSTNGPGNAGTSSTLGSKLTAYFGSGGSYGNGGPGGGGGGILSGGSTTAGLNYIGGSGIGAVGTFGQGGYGSYYDGNDYPAESSYYGGGGGGGTYSYNTGGASYYGGGGGGGQSASGSGSGGTSKFGGSGGSGGATGTAGTAPGGGGGGSTSGNSGAGAAGKVIITVFPA